MKLRPLQILAPAMPKGLRRKDIFGGRYTIYEDGTLIRNPFLALGRSGCMRKMPAIKIRGVFFKGYYQASITHPIHGAMGVRTIHSLVCEAFNGKPKRGEEVNHIDGKKLNNRASNLEWLTRPKNQQHAADNGLKPVGEASHLHKLTTNQVQKVRALLRSGNLSQAAIGRRFGVSQTCISKIFRNEKWKQLKPIQ